jgi:predicted MFS family arabinose efflux permease
MAAEDPGAVGAVSATSRQEPPERSPWPALWALVLGFFMILVDTTIVSVATPAIMTDLGTDVNGVVWVISSGTA